MRIKLTQNLIVSITPPAKGEFWLRDSEQPGLKLRVRSTGDKSLFVRYRLGRRGTRNPRLITGSVKKVSLKTAREMARRALDEVAKGRDPAADAQATEPVMPPLRHYRLEVGAAGYSWFDEQGIGVAENGPRRARSLAGD